MKSQFLNMCINYFDIKSNGYHSFYNKNRSYYEFGGFGFHLNYSQKNDLFLGGITEEISCAKNKSKMTLKKALNIYREFAKSIGEDFVPLTKQEKWESQMIKEYRESKERALKWKLG